MTPKQAATCGGPLDELLDPEVFKALSDPTRARMLGCLTKCGRACSVSEVAECCEVDLSVVSRHLKLLERAGIVEAVKQGRVVSYAVRYAHLCTLLRSLASAIAACDPDQHGRTNGSACGATCVCKSSR